MSEYMLRTDDIRRHWTQSAPASDGYEAAMGAMFDRWLKAHDAQVASEAAERALRDAADAFEGGNIDHGAAQRLGVENYHPARIHVQEALRARADRLARGRNGG